MGACGARAAGSEIQPYLEGGNEAAALSGGRRGAGWPGDPEPYHRGRRVRRPGLQGGGWLGEAALRVSVKLKRLLVIGRLSGVGHHRLGCTNHFTKRSMSGSQVLNWLVLVMSCWMRCWQTVNAEFESSPEFFSTSME